jgi:hypothetical protein
MNRKAQNGPVGFVILIFIIVALWFLWLGERFSIIGADAIANNNMVGLEAFMWANLNLWFWLCMILGVMGYMYFAGSY